MGEIYKGRLVTTLCGKNTKTTLTQIATTTSEIKTFMFNDLV